MKRLKLRYFSHPVIICHFVDEVVNLLIVHKFQSIATIVSLIVV